MLHYRHNGATAYTCYVNNCHFSLLKIPIDAKSLIHCHNICYFHVLYRMSAPCMKEAWAMYINMVAGNAFL